jgi:hypothetical protein
VLVGCLGASFACTDDAFGNHSITALLSKGTSGGNGAYDAVYKANSRDGAHVLFGTQEQLAPTDTDSSWDVYDTFGAVSSLVSIGPGGGNGAFDAVAAGMSSDGTHDFFLTQEQLVPQDDTDAVSDLYERAGGATKLVSTGPDGGNGSFPVDSGSFEGSSADGSHVFFQTDEQLVLGDTDSATDIYERSADTTTLVSTGSTGGNGNFGASAKAVSDDGSRVIFETAEQLTGGDGDTNIDVYAHAGGTTELLSTGVTDRDATFKGASGDATAVVFKTVGSCFNGFYYQDCDVLWLNSGGTTSQVSGPALRAEFGGISQNGGHVFYWSDEPDAEGSADYCGSDPYGDYDFGCPDLFDYSGGTRRTVTAGGPYNCTLYYWPDACFWGYSFGGSTPDGTHVYFTTQETLAAPDNDGCLYEEENNGCSDLYENSVAEGTKLVSGRGNSGGQFLGVSDDASRVFFLAGDLVPGDTDQSPDIYERYANAYYLLSVGPSGGSDPYPNYSTYKGASADGTRVFFQTKEKLVPADTDSSVDIYHSRVGAGYPVPRGATPIRVSLVPAYQACTAPNRTHGSPLAFPSCAPPVLASPNLTIGIGDGIPPVARSIGSLSLGVHAGASGPPDDSDVSLKLRISNVFKSADFTDYTGELEARLSARLTDKQSAGQATTQDFPFSFTSPCTMTADTVVGAVCSIDTTFNAVVPGSVIDAQRAIWALDEVRIYDGGPDGDAETPGNSLFEVQGVFVP